MKEMITLKLEKSFLKAIDTFRKKHHYDSRTEFIREALREKIENKGAREVFLNQWGKTPAHTMNEDIEKRREAVAQWMLATSEKERKAYLETVFKKSSGVKK